LPNTKEWEMPASQINKVLELFEKYKITITANVITEAHEEKPINVVAKFDNVVHVDFNYKTQPFPHQVDAFNYAHMNPKFLLGDEQGLGKTKQSIDIAVSRKHQFKHCLIVCCINSTKRNWLNEIKTHSNE